ncbi:hypothetical protein A3F27_00710 [Candidatus Kaiserbacteria bacterium RIFCSPHIGHO2_12_FULL_53_13]|uniref:Type II secretion system protein GspG C-terminal domain-containing protein n=1 Tax=Candidatus Kaiserbacteria bacterium RIFCSPHIGHO2_12_FULL_53_13 TaxID=1798502 RepID=A0A1F6E7V8_9BACT|nr:MAG: hypothetical protein A3F27_00710 [Candidatus Kaiserbacteria bacterium RIFCSPHIGHO2_12_FULL_53_13]OGG74561.1 MAG: hypothetical protein A3A37_00715 [Candidatus Kaiserbacteria bacterium RIFCSPLOWO2_01_FULL_52_36]
MDDISKETRNKGFTLIELLVVIAIIGILSSVVLASLNSARQKGRDARRVSDVKQLQLALELYYDATGGYPLALSTANLVTNGYISVVPIDPSSTTSCTDGTQASCYKYAPLLVGSACASYHLGATLEVTSNSALNNDSDAAAGTVCVGTVNNTSNLDFTSTSADAIYDVKP